MESVSRKALSYMIGYCALADDAWQGYLVQSGFFLASDH